MTTLSENLERLEETIAEACRAAGRARGEVDLMAVSKTFPAEAIVEAAGLGIRLFGENRVQEFEKKSAELGAKGAGSGFPGPQTRGTWGTRWSGLSGLRSETWGTHAEEPGGGLPGAQGRGTWGTQDCIELAVREPRVHLIGHLQSNKAARAAELFDGIDSLDSVRLAERLNEAAGKLGKRLPVLIEVKLSQEETKEGLEPEREEMARLLERLPDFTHLEMQGLMTIAPWGAPENVTRACFHRLREWRERWAREHPRLDFSVLSMGMSGDFPLAIAEGATRIRVGTALFGKRGAQL